MKSTKTRSICPAGHEYFKSSDCPICPVCDKEKAATTGFLSRLSSPARRVLLHHGIDTLEILSRYTENEILQLHGLGKSSIPVLKKILLDNGLDFAPEIK